MKDYDEYSPVERDRVYWRALFGGVDESGARVRGLKDDAAFLRRAVKAVAVAALIMLAHTLGLPTDHLPEIISAVAQAHGIR
jgi:hypothetical protein